MKPQEPTEFDNILIKILKPYDEAEMPLPISGLFEFVMNDKASGYTLELRKRAMRRCIGCPIDQEPILQAIEPETKYLFYKMFQVTVSASENDFEKV